MNFSSGDDDSTPGSLSLDQAEDAMARMRVEIQQEMMQGAYYDPGTAVGPAGDRASSIVTSCDVVQCDKSCRILALYRKAYLRHEADDALFTTSCSHCP
jgi:hypothetical protein